MKPWWSAVALREGGRPPTTGERRRGLVQRCQALAGSDDLRNIAVRSGPHREEQFVRPAGERRLPLSLERQTESVMRDGIARIDLEDAIELGNGLVEAPELEIRVREDVLERLWIRGHRPVRDRLAQVHDRFVLRSALQRQ